VVGQSISAMRPWRTCNRETILSTVVYAGSKIESAAPRDVHAGTNKRPMSPSHLRVASYVSGCGARGSAAMDERRVV